MPDLQESAKIDTFKRTHEGKKIAYEFIGFEIIDESEASVVVPNNIAVVFSQEVGYPPITAGVPGDRYFAAPQITVYEDSVSDDNRIPDGSNAFVGGTALFGKQSVGATTATIENVIRGTKFTTSEGGMANSISVHLAVTTASHKVKCALYEYISDGDAGERIATTEEKTIAVSTGFNTFNFTTRPRLERNRTYYIVAWAEAVGGNCLIAADIVANQGVFASLTYNSFPDPMTGEVSSSGEFAIYCNYTRLSDYVLVHWVDWGSTDTRNWEISFKTFILNRTGSTQTILYRANVRRIIKGD